MKRSLVAAPTPATCAPITCGRELGNCWVGGSLLADLQKRCLNRVHETGLSLFLRSDAWVPCDSLAELISWGVPALYRDEDGQALAWAGGDGNAPAQEARIIPAPKSCFLIRYPWHLLRINEQVVGRLAESVVAGEVSERAEVNGFLALGEGSRILPGVYIEGNVVIGRRCKIGPNCYLRGNTAIGDDCHIGQAVEIKNSLIMANTSIGHLSYCGDSVVGVGVNLGAGTITANFRHDGRNHASMVGGELLDTGRRKFGAIIGDAVHTGIHTSIYPGRKIWPGMATRPGDVVQRDLKP